MRLNLPVSNIEVTLPDGAVIVCSSDLKGVITYCNSTFAEVSGFSRDEIVGSPHNIVRHPDMPPGAFADLWKTIKANKPWQGVVKNRRKDGSFYWAVSNITPLKEKGKTIGYVAFRYKATQEQIAQAANAYQEIRAGSRKLRIEEGNVVQIINPLLHWMNAFSVRARLVALMLTLLGALVAVGAFSLLEAEKAHERATDSLTNAGTQAYALTMARSAEAAFKEQRHAWKNILIRGRSTASLKRYLDEFDRRGEEVEHILTGLLIPVMPQIGLPTSEVGALLESHMLLNDKYHSILKRSDAHNLLNIPVLDALTEESDQRITEQFDAIIGQGVENGDIQQVMRVATFQYRMVLVVQQHVRLQQGTDLAGGQADLRHDRDQQACQDMLDLLPAPVEFIEVSLQRGRAAAADQDIFPSMPLLLEGCLRTTRHRQRVGLRARVGQAVCRALMGLLRLEQAEGAHRNQRSQQGQHERNQPRPDAEGIHPVQQRVDYLDDIAFLDAQLARARADLLVGVRGLRNLLLRGLVAERHIADGFALFLQRGDVGYRPVEAAVLAPVLDHPLPGLVGLDGLPHIGERPGWHIGMAHDIVRRADDLIAAEPAHFNERAVAIGDDALEVGLGDDHRPVRQRDLDV